jgi:hypothetical protein
MCLRAWEKGGRVEVCPDAWVESNNIIDEVREGNMNKFFDKDTETFFNRWHGKLGKGMEKDWRIINRPIYIPPSYFYLIKFFPSFVHQALFRVYCGAFRTAGKIRRALISKHLPIPH